MKAYKLATAEPVVRSRAKKKSVQPQVPLPDHVAIQQTPLLASATTEEHVAHVEAVKAQVDAGAYTANSEAIAHKMLATCPLHSLLDNARRSYSTAEEVL